MSLPLHHLLPSPISLSSSPSSSSPLLLSFRHQCRTSLSLSCRAAGRNAKFHPSPADDDPPEAPEDSSHGISRVQQFERQVKRAHRRQEEQLRRDEPSILSALTLDPNTTSNSSDLVSDTPVQSSSDDLFDDIDRAIALKRQEYVNKGLLKPSSTSPLPEDLDELSPEEVVDLDEIRDLQGLTVISCDDEGESMDDNASNLLDEKRISSPAINPSGFDLEFDNYGTVRSQILEPKFNMTLAELLDESRVVPVSVFGDLEVVITGMQHDSREVCSGDLFVCYPFFDNDGQSDLTEADKRGAVAVITDREINIDETLNCKALVVVEDVAAVLPVLSAAFYKHPSKNLSVIGIVGTNGKTTTTHLIKAIYEAMGVRTGMLGTLGYFIQGDSKFEATKTTPDAVMVQKLMATMLHNGTEAVVVEASSQGIALGRCNEVDFDVAVFTNLTRNHPDFHMTEEEYRISKGKLFARMADPERHRMVVNIDDPNATYFISQGNPDVPVISYAMENKGADVHLLKFELSLFETQVLVKTPQGVLEISSGLIGRHNIYNILAAVAVGIAVGAPLEDIVRGIEEVDAVPGRCELIDEEQAFAVLVDYARTPDGLSKLLDTCRELSPKRIITVFGCEGDNDRGKRPLMTKIATDKSDVVILTSDNPYNEDPLDILDDMLAGVGWSMQDYLKYGENDYYPPLSNGHRLFVHDIRRVAVRAAVAMGEEGDIVVIAGKGHETYQIEGDKKDFIDDREECREALHYVDELHQAGIDTSEFPWRLPESH